MLCYACYATLCYATLLVTVDVALGGEQSAAIPGGHFAKLLNRPHCEKVHPKYLVAKNIPEVLSANGVRCLC